MEELSLKASRMLQTKSNVVRLQKWGKASLDMVLSDSLSKDGMVRHPLYANRIKTITLSDNHTIVREILAKCPSGEQASRKYLQRTGCYCIKHDT